MGRDSIMEEIVVVGAGVAGLACARALARRRREGGRARQGRGVGGRCATPAGRGQSVDHGVAFLHGCDPDFLAAIEAVEGATRLEAGRRVHGTGSPCQPAAFDGPSGAWPSPRA